MGVSALPRPVVKKFFAAGAHVAVAAVVVERAGERVGGQVAGAAVVEAARGVVVQAVGDVVEGDGGALVARAAEAAEVDADLLQEVAGDEQELRVDGDDRRGEPAHVVHHRRQLGVHGGARLYGEVALVLGRDLDAAVGGRPVGRVGALLQGRHQLVHLDERDLLVGLVAGARLVGGAGFTPGMSRMRGGRNWVRLNTRSRTS